jgi:DNA-binding NarL/FixJ family response regulator
MPNINRGRVAIEWYLDREKRAEKKAAENAAKASQIKGLQRKSRKQLNEYTERENQVLRAYYNTLGPDILAERLGRTRASVGTQANSLGLRFGQ